MGSKLRKYREYELVVKRLLLFGGLWPRLEDTFPGYRLLTFACFFIIATLAAKVGAFAVNNINNILIFVRSMGNVLSSCTSIVKIFCYLVYRQDLEMLNEELGGKFDEELDENKQIRDYLLERISTFVRFTRIALIVTGATLVLYTLPPFFVYFKYKKFVQVYQGSYPFAIQPGSKLYWLICLFESSSMPLAWLIICGTDCTFGLHSFRLCGLQRSLAERMRRLGSDRGLCAGDRMSYLELAEILGIQRLLLRARDALQRVYGPIIIWSYVTNAIIMCSVLYQIEQDKKRMTVAKLLFYLFYIAVKLSQSFTYAYYGSLVAQESEKCQNAIYDSDWAGSGDVRLMKNVLIIQTQRPIVMKASGFFIVTMSMFEKILNTTLSYFFLLQTIGE